MIDREEKSGPATEQTERARWEAPELRKLDAGEAEAALGTGGDNTVFS